MCDEINMLITRRENSIAMERYLREEEITEFERFLKKEERSEATITKYCRDLRAFAAYAEEIPISKEIVLRYKQKLIADGYAVRSINSMISSVNSALAFFKWDDCKIKTLKIQQQIYSSEKAELTMEDYRKLLNASKNNPRLNMILQTICSTGIRVSELAYFTVQAVKLGKVTVFCKSKIRTVFLPRKLKQRLLSYARGKNIEDGIIFRTRNGNPVNRSNIWNAMKRLCEKAGVLASKVFPHNLRKLFARTFYTVDKDIAKLADVLGHSSIETTRIYIKETGKEHIKKIEMLGLVV